LLEAVSNAALGQVVRRHLDQNLVAGQHADAILAHAASGVSDDLVIVLELDPERGIGQQFGDHTRKFKDFFLWHPVPSVVLNHDKPGDRPRARTRCKSWRGTYSIRIRL